MRAQLRSCIKMTYTVSESTAKLSELIEAVEASKQVTITRDGRPVADLVLAKWR